MAKIDKKSSLGETMLIESIKIINFKCHKEVSLSFSETLNLITGPNGVGKTNLLDAIYFLSMTKSVFNTADIQIPYLGEMNFFVQGVFKSEDTRIKIQGGVDGTTKNFLSDGKTYERLSEHIGKIPLVFVSPYDTDLIRQSAEVRRRFFDALGCLIDPVYMNNLMRYNHLLKQRNALLERSTGHPIDPNHLEAYNEPLIKLNKSIASFRKELVEGFLHELTEHYRFLSEEKEEVNLRYESTVLSEEFEGRYYKNLQQDRIKGKTGLGIHKDDFAFEIDGNLIRKYGSQGQQKTFVLALRLAQYFYLKKSKKKSPILLLDDIFDKLDDDRISQLAGLLKTGKFGQVFITDARPERSRVLLGEGVFEIKFPRSSINIMVDEEF